ncbi:MAG TPA: MoaD family protein [Conexivisphaerales archaeon]|nr:MoaD family protein [Conexivisphaerales archaeon]
MPRVTLRYFASVREALEMPEETASVEGEKVADVLAWLVAHHGRELIPLVFDTKRELREEFRLLHNGSLVPRADAKKVRVKDGDEIVLMPPVAGGR